jgi:Family of unknown function (DUF6491)
MRTVFPSLPLHAVRSGTALIVVLALAVAPYRASASPSCERHAAREHRALRVEGLANWEPIDDQTVLIWTGSSIRAYLVRLARPLDHLMVAPIIALLDGDRDRTISPCGDDAVTVDDGEDTEVSPIVSIERLSEKRTAQLDPAAQRPAPGLKRI